MDKRKDSLQTWVRQCCRDKTIQLRAIDGDASFRQYFRFAYQGQALLAVDAPNEHEDNPAFVAVAQGFAQMGLSVPDVLHADFQAGFLIISDLGDGLYSTVLNSDNADRLYQDALLALTRLQVCHAFGEWHLPRFDSTFIIKELGYFKEWFLQRLLDVHLTAVDRDMLDDCFAQLIAVAEVQPVVCIHRDYHSRNLLQLQRGGPGIIDFQGAMYGPLTYDVVSLLKDCYIVWPKNKVRQWALFYRDCALHSEILQDDDEAAFLQWFDILGVQRHLKAIGIFARLCLRDNKKQYLASIPRTLAYVQDACQNETKLHPFASFLAQRVQPLVERF